MTRKAPPSNSSTQNGATTSNSRGTSQQLSPMSSSQQGDSGTTPMPLDVPLDTLVVRDIFSAMKTTLGFVENTLDSLGDSSAKFVEMSPAIQAAAQVAVLQRQLDDQISQQQIHSEKLATLVESLLTSLSDDLSSRLDSIISEIVEKKIEERVRLQLNEQMPGDVLQQSRDHKRQMLEVQASLRNSEARRHNATLRESSFTQPLRPLLRPLSTPLQSPAHTSIPPTPISGDISTTPTTSTSTLDDFGPPTPSPLFPRDIASLFKLGPDDARALVKDYGLEDIPEEHDDVPIGGGPEGTDGSATPVASPTRRTAEEAFTRERDLSRFMAHIGVPFRLVPQKSSRNDRARLPPLIINY